MEIRRHSETRTSSDNTDNTDNTETQTVLVEDKFDGCTFGLRDWRRERMAMYAGRTMRSAACATRQIMVARMGSSSSNEHLHTPPHGSRFSMSGFHWQSLTMTLLREYNNIRLV